MGQMGSGASTRLFLSRSMIDIVEVILCSSIILGGDVPALILLMPWTSPAEQLQLSSSGYNSS